MKSKKYVIYVEKSFVMMKIMKKNLKTRGKSEIIIITPENREEMLLVNAV